MYQWDNKHNMTKRVTNKISWYLFVYFQIRLGLSLFLLSLIRTFDSLYVNYWKSSRDRSFSLFGRPCQTQATPSPPKTPLCYCKNIVDIWKCRNENLIQWLISAFCQVGKWACTFFHVCVIKNIFDLVWMEYHRSWQPDRTFHKLSVTKLKDRRFRPA